MPSFAALTSLVLLAASDLVAAQISAPNCSLLWEWSFNSLGQNACTVAAYLMSTCNSGAFNISPLPSGFWYTGPAAAEGANTCKCNTVAYNLVSACDGCQAEIWISWVEYSTNCTAILAPSTFPNAVPEGTRVPHWALMDPTLEGFWDLTASLHAGDSPEVMPGSFISASTPTSTLAAGAGGHATSTITTKSGVAGPSSDPESKSRSGSSSSTATIAGGVVGGVVVLAIIGAVLFYFLRKRRLSRTPSATFVVDPDMPIQLSVSQMGQVAFPSDEGSTYAAGTPVSPVKLYDPNDPYTYPGYQRVSTTDAQVPAMPYETGLNGNTLGGNTMGRNTLGGNTLNGNTVGRNTLANRQTTHPVGGYHGLPTI
ncbi:hypothetical protein V8E53_006844 [Lactarius tabidus]